MVEEGGDVAGAVAAEHGEIASAVAAALTGVVCSTFGCSNAWLRHRLKGECSSALTGTVAIATAANWRWAVTNQKCYE